MPKVDPMWLDRDLVGKIIEGVEFKELKYDPDNGLYCLNGEPFTGVSKTRGQTGKLDGLSQHKGGVEEGVSVGWYPNGQIEMYSEMEDDVYHGWHIEWEEDGTKRLETHYTMGVADDPDNR